MLSEAKHLSRWAEMLRFAQHDKTLPILLVQFHSRLLQLCWLFSSNPLLGPTNRGAHECQDMHAPVHSAEKPVSAKCTGTWECYLDTVTQQQTMLDEVAL